jgi:hypothetical protein
VMTPNRIKNVKSDVPSNRCSDETKRSVS